MERPEPKTPKQIKKGDPCSMGYVATLVGPADGTLHTGHIVTAQNIFNTHAAPDWLDEGRAADLPLNGRKPSADKVRDARTMLDAQGIALFVQETEGRRKSLLLADMESTMVDFEALDELAKKAGAFDQIAKITAKAMNGEMDFRQALEERVRALKGLPVSHLEKALQTMMKKINPGAQSLVAKMKKNGAVCVLVTGGFTYFAQPLADHLGFDACHANSLEITGGKLTGRVEEPILDREVKLKCLQTYCGIRGIPASDVLAIGDGANDIPMLQAAGLGIGYCPKPAVSKAVLNIIPKGGLDAALYAQGYRKSEIVAGPEPT